MSATPESQPAEQAQQQQGVQIPEWVLNLVGRQALELEILRQQLAAGQTGITPAVAE